MKLRVKITKEGDIRFISHLEYFRAINRAIRRARLPVAYSEGFNPHIRMSLASALGVGIASMSEYAEIDLEEEITPEEAKQLLNENLPQGLRVIDADVVSRKERKLMAQLEGATYTAIFETENSDRLKDAIKKYNELTEYLYKKSAAPGKKAKEIDIKEYVSEIYLNFSDANTEISFDAIITPTGTIKAFDILNVLKELIGDETLFKDADMTRTALYKNDKESLIGN